jgi:cytidylate kinase
MGNILLEYMKRRMQTEREGMIKTKTSSGPVVTIARDYGCPAKRLAGMLTSALNRIELENYSKDRWKWIGKELLDEAANELNLKPEMVRDIVNTEQKNVLDDIILSVSHKYYPGDFKVKETMGQVIRSFADQGHIVIVGRGGESITRDIPDSLHIKITAPLKWRINQISQRQNLEISEAEKKIRDIDHKRARIREFFEKQKVDDSSYDIILNYMTIAEEDIISTIVHLMKCKGIV